MPIRARFRRFALAVALLTPLGGCSLSRPLVHGPAPAPVPAEPESPVVVTTDPAPHSFVPFPVAARPLAHGIPASTALDPAGLERVTTSTAGACFDPDLSPDGRLLVFASTQHRATADLYLKHTDGRTVTRLTDTAGDEVTPAFSPDGSTVAYASNRDGDWNLYLTDVEGRTQVQLTDDAAHELHPTWSPDGGTVAFCRFGDRSGRWEIWTLDVERQLETFLTYGLFPRWSPVDGRIAFQRARERDGEQFGIWTINARPDEARRLTEIVSADDGSAMHPSWSPDGRHLAFVATPNATGGPADVWMIGADGSARTRLTGGTAYTLSPVWTPNGEVMFVSDRSGTDNIWTIATNVVPARAPETRVTEATE